MKRHLFFLCLACQMVTLSVFALPAQVIVIRHSEKDADGNLTQRGFERAGALAHYLTKSPYLTNFGTPVAIFAARPNNGKPPYQPDENTRRCLDSVGPTAQLLKLPIHAGFTKFQEPELAEFILNSSKYDGKNVLICWHHETIQELLIALGVTSVEPVPDVFDLVWLIQYNPSANLTLYHQALFLGDTP